MPSFREALADDQIEMVIGHVRNFCREPAWPRGELNFPRALVTEKAFPEDEMVMDVAINAEGNAGITDRVVYEKRLGSRGQLDVSLAVQVSGVRVTAAGIAAWEISLPDTNTCWRAISAQVPFSASPGETVFATGNAERDMGKGRHRI